MDKTIILILLFLVVTGCKNAGPSYIEEEEKEEIELNSFYKTFGGAKEEYGFSLDNATDGGYILTGFTTSKGAGEWDIWIVKTDSEGNGLWSKVIGESFRENAFEIKQTSDGGYIIAAEQGLQGKGGDIYIIKINSVGEIIWEKTMGGTENEGARDIIETSDGHFVVVGYTYSLGMPGRDIWLVKLDSDGNNVWDKVYGWAYSETGFSLSETADGGFFIIGDKYNHEIGNQDIWLLKVDVDGEEEWSRKIGKNATAYGHSIVSLDDGMYVAAGVTDSLGNDWFDLWIIKFDFSGNILWENIYPFSNSEVNLFSKVDVNSTKDGGVICVGPTTLFGRDQDALLIKLDKDGIIEWSYAYGGKDNDVGLSVVQAQDGGFAFLGRTNSFGNGLYDFFLVKTDSLGRNLDLSN